MAHGIGLLQAAPARLMCCWLAVAVVVDRALVVAAVELAGYVLLLALASLATSLSRLVVAGRVHPVRD